METQTIATQTAAHELTERDKILVALESWIKQRPGLEYGNYARGWNDTEGRKAYFSEMRSITRDLHHARELLTAIGWRSGITAEHLKDAFRNAYSGRLTWEPVEGRPGAYRLQYCTGQYWPTEYRRAVCAVLASALWTYFRDQCGAKTGDDVRKMARRELSRAVAQRWFR